MNKFLNLSIGLISILGMSQQIIIDKSIEKDCKSVGFHYSLNNDLFLVNKRKPVGGLVAADYIYNMSSYDKKGTETVISDKNKILAYTTSNNNNSIFAYVVNKSVFNQEPILINNNKTYELDKSIVKKLFPFNHILLSSKKLHSLTDKKGFNKFKIGKDVIYYNVLNSETNELNSNIIHYDLTKLVGSEFIKPEENIASKIKVNYNDSVDIITKSITKDYKKVILYKRRVSDEGETIKETEYKLELPDNLVFIYSDCSAGNYTTRTNTSFPYFDDDLFINNYIEDYTNGDIYIYGLFGDKAEKLNVSNNIKGFYIFKFDKNGKKIWETINPINDKSLNKEHGLSSVYVDLFQIKNNLFFEIKIYGLKDFFNATLLSKDTGEINKSKNFEFSESFSQMFKRNQFFGINDELKRDINFRNKKFGFQTVAFINFDNRIKEYIKNVKSKKQVQFNIFPAIDGFWLTETDDKNYYKVIYFEHE